MGRYPRGLLGSTTLLLGVVFARTPPVSASRLPAAKHVAPQQPVGAAARQTSQADPRWGLANAIITEDEKLFWVGGADYGTVPSNTTSIHGFVVDADGIRPKYRSVRIVSGVERHPSVTDWHSTLLT